FEKATDKLISALDTDLACVHAHTDLLTQAIKWEANSKSRSLVLRGDALKAAEQWLAQAPTKKEPKPTTLQTEYINASRKAATRRLQVTLGAVTLGLVVAVAFAVAAFVARQEALNANKRTSEAASRANVSIARYSKEAGKNGEALAQLAQALRLNPKNREAAGLTAAMLAQLGWHVPLAGPMQHRDEVGLAQFSPDGHWLVTISKDKTAYLWDAARGLPIGDPMKHENYIDLAQFSPNNQRLVTVSADTAQVWDVTSGKKVGKPMKDESGVRSAQFSPDSQRVLTASAKTVQVWDAASGLPIGNPMEHESIFTSAQFSPDGQRILAASSDKTVQVWDAATGLPIGKSMEHESIVTSAQFSRDSQRVLTASAKTVQVWDAATGLPIGK